MERPEGWTDGRRSGGLDLLEPYRGSDGKWWVRARCVYCSGEKRVRWSHVCPGVSRVPTSCGCVNSARFVSYVGRQLGRNVVVHDDGAPCVIVACPRGHAWAIRRDLIPSRDRDLIYAASGCEECRVAKTIDLTGEVFGRLRVLGRAGTDTPADGRFRGQATWRVQCLCGTVKAVRGAHLRRGAVKTCGAPECRAR